MFPRPGRIAMAKHGGISFEFGNFARRLCVPGLSTSGYNDEMRPPRRSSPPINAITAPSPPLPLYSGVAEFIKLH